MKIIKKIKKKLILYMMFRKYKKNKNIKIAKQCSNIERFELDISKEAKVFIGTNLSIRKNVSIRVRDDSELILGNRVFFNNNCILTCRKKIIISDDVIFGPNVVIFDHDHDYKSKDIKNNFVYKEIFIGKNVWIGANACILKGSNIGDNSIVAAGAIVNCDIPANSLFISKDKIKKIGENNE